MEWLIGVGCFAFSAGCFLAGISLGCWLCLVLSERFKRSAALAYQEGVEKAKREYQAFLAQGKERADRYQANPLNMHKEEREVSFEESIKNMYPDDPEAQKKAREEREFKKKMEAG